MNKTSFLRLLNRPWRFSAFLFFKLPAAWFMGLRLLDCDGQTARVALPYRWRSQNPFRSTYFAAQCAAGELSTGVLGLLAMQEHPPVSMLVTEVRARFYKKADQTLVFTCSMGADVQALIDKAVVDGQAHTLTMLSEGRLPDGVLAAEIEIVWSFKRRGGGG